MNRVLQSVNVNTKYEDNIVRQANDPIDFNGQAIWNNFRALGATLAADTTRDMSHILGRLFAASLNQQVMLTRLDRQAADMDPRLIQDNFSVEEVMKTVDVTIVGDIEPTLWWVETTTTVPHCEWLELAAVNVDAVLVPTVKAWVLSSNEAVVDGHLCGTCRA